MKKRADTLIWTCILCLASVFFISSVTAACPDNQWLNIQVTDSSNNTLTGTFTFQFNITTSADCTGVLYSNTTTQATDNKGRIAYSLDNLGNVDFSSARYLCYYRDGLLKLSRKLGIICTNANITFNATYDTWLPNYTLSSKYWYNFSSVSPASIYNSTYNTWAYNQTYSGSTYNSTYAGGAVYWYNYSLVAQANIYNISYDSWLPNYSASGKYWYNMTYSGSTFNTTYASGIPYWYNFSLVSLATIYNVSYDTWLPNYTLNSKYWYNFTLITPASVYNSSYNACVPYAYNQTYSGSTFNSTYAGGIPYWYNFSTVSQASVYNSSYDTWLPNYTLSSKYWYNFSSVSPASVYNSSYNACVPYAYNQTYSGSTYNSTYAGGAVYWYNYSSVAQANVYNVSYDSWLPNYTLSSKYWYNFSSVSPASIYNSTYNTWAYNQTYSGSTFNSTYAGGIPYWYNLTTPAITYADARDGTANLHTHNAANITAGVFGAGNYNMSGNLTYTDGNGPQMGNATIYWDGAKLVIRVR